MIRINLRPPAKVHVSYHVTIYFIIALTVMSAFAYAVPYYLSNQLQDDITTIKTKNQDKTNELKKLKDKKSKIDSLKTTFTDVQKRSSQIQKISEDRKRIVFILDKIQQFHMERMWLNKLTIAANKITLSGYALNHYIVSEYLAKLRTHTSENINIILDAQKFTPPLLSSAPSSAHKTGTTNKTDVPPHPDQNPENSNDDPGDDDADDTEDTDGGTPNGIDVPKTAKREHEEGDTSFDDDEDNDLQENLFYQKMSNKKLSAINFQNINLKKTTSEDILGIPYQHFDIEFEISN